MLDEAHFIKDRSTSTAKAVFALTSLYKWCLTGTPLQNRVSEPVAQGVDVGNGRRFYYCYYYLGVCVCVLKTHLGPYLYISHRLPCALVLAVSPCDAHRARYASLPFWITTTAVVLCFTYTTDQEYGKLMMGALFFLGTRKINMYAYVQVTSPTPSLPRSCVRLPRWGSYTRSCGS